MSSPSAFGGTIYLVLIQVASRALTFVGNQFLLRFLSPELLGIAVQLELLSVSVLYFSRESLRVALQKQPAAPATVQSRSLSTQIVVNVSYVAVVLGLLLTLGLTTLYAWGASSEITGSPFFMTGLGIYGVATAIEVLSEPSFVVIQQRGLYKDRARSETMAAILKCLTACVTASFMHHRTLPPSVLPFAVGQLVYAVTLLGCYLQTTQPLSSGEQFSLLPKCLNLSKVKDKMDRPALILSRFSRPLLTLAGTLYAQSIFKQLLTQGDALLLSVLAPLADQGAFALAANYGGLLARLLFQPVEESARSTFGALLSTSSPTSKSKQAAKGQAKAHLTQIIHLYALLTLPCLTVLPPLLPLLVSALTGARFATPQLAALLRTYAATIPLLAFNGILDAFVVTVATPAQLRTQSLAMAGCTAVYGGAAALCLGPMGLGARGLVLANAVGMGARIGWSWLFVGSWMKENEMRDGEKGEGRWWAGAVPNLGSVAAAVVVGVALHLELGVSQIPSTGRKIAGVDVMELGRLVAAGAFLGSAILFSERDFLQQTISQILPERLASKLDMFRPKAPSEASKSR